MSPEFITLTTLYFLALLSPGQDFFLIVSNALHQGYQKAWWSCAGIAFGNAIYIAIASIGHALFSDGFLFIFFQVGGALFLIYLGFVLLSTQNRVQEGTHVYVSTRFKLFTQGALSALLNPKNIVFYFSILFTIIPSQSTLHVKLLYGVWMVCLLLFWDMSVALLFGNRRAKALLPYLFILQKAVGGALICFACFELYTLSLFS